MPLKWEAESDVVFKYFTQATAGKEDAALDSAHRHGEFFGNLLILISGDMHIEGLAITFGESGDDSGNLITGISAIGSSVGGIHSHIDGGIVFTNIDSGILPGGFSVIIDEDIAHNSEHPTLEIHISHKAYQEEG